MVSSIIASSSCCISTRLYYDKVASDELVATPKEQNRQTKEECKFLFANLSGIIFQLKCYYIVAISPKPLKS